MQLRWLGSLEGKLVVRLTALMLAAMGAGFFGLAIYSQAAARKIADEALKDALVADFLHDAAWAFPLMAVVVLAVTVWTVRSSLRPLHIASESAAKIAPGQTAVRLATSGLPAELAPLVAAVNGGLDRLEKGFNVQRQFTGNAAHELRTPLAILTVGLEDLPQSAEVVRLRQDVDRMNRLVAQLLRVARLDAEPIDVSQVVDLGAVASEVVALLAPWAAKGQSCVAFEACEAPVRVRGDQHALGDAIRNLVENAIAHGPPGEEITVRLERRGALSVIDRGPGVPLEHREKIFERFWRSQARRSSGLGAGLGLAIVAEIANAHGGSILVTDAPGGGGCFTLDLSAARIDYRGSSMNRPERAH